MRGMNAHTGQALAGIEHIQQSISDILLTPLGSRVMRREYGSLLPDLIDQPINDALLLQLYAATVMAVQQWEPRVTINQVRFTPAANTHASNRLTLSVTRRDTAQNSPASLSLTLGGAV